MKTILLISADPDTLPLLKQILSPYYLVHRLLPSDSVFEKVAEFYPDLLITDFMLGDSNGGALCHQVKSNPATAAISVILLSEFRMMRRSFSKFGCDAIVQKPLQKHELFDWVQLLLCESAVLL